MLDFLNSYKYTMLLNTKSCCYYVVKYQNPPNQRHFLSNEKNHFSKLQPQLSYTFSIFVILSFIKCPYPALAAILYHSSPLLFCVAPNKTYYLSITVQHKHIPQQRVFPCVFTSSCSNTETSTNMQSNKRKNKFKPSNYAKLCS